VSGRNLCQKASNPSCTKRIVQLRAAIGDTSSFAGVWILDYVEEKEKEKIKLKKVKKKQ